MLGLFLPPNFKKKIIETLAKRAAYKCSNPDCQILTIGPNSNSDSATIIGEAAHIYGARPASKRYKSDMTDYTRAQITNGLWLCTNCHKKIDRDESRYPANLLFRWVEEHEAWIASELGSTGDRFRHEVLQRTLSKYETYPAIVRRILATSPPGWEWQITAEIFRHLCKPKFQKIEDIQEGLYTQPLTRIELDEFAPWVSTRVHELGKIFPPIGKILVKLTKSWGTPREEGNLEEIQRCCQLLADNLEQVVEIEESLKFVLVDERLQPLINMLKDRASSQAMKLSEIPVLLDGVVAMIGTEHGGNNDNPTTISKTFDMELPENWGRDIDREWKRIEHILR